VWLQSFRLLPLTVEEVYKVHMAIYNSLYAEIIYTFQFSNMEIAHNQHCQVW